jgi:UDP-N-acetylglucosamine:LPS N-acetylglucosamine transferase
VRRGQRRDALRFVGARRGLEARAVPAAGFAIELLPGRGIRRSLRPSALWDNLGSVWGLLWAFGRALTIVRRTRPRVVFGVGGYAALPCMLAARLRKVPAVVHEANAAPGLTNRLAVRLGARSAVSLPGTPLRGAVLTGNPVREAVAAVRRRPGAGLPVVAVVGGSLGAGRLNDAALALYERWRDRDDVTIRHVTGERGFADCHARLGAARRSGDALAYELVAYEDRMDELYAEATLFVCRAGAVTVAELAVTGMPSVLVPLPGAPGDHQTHNARALVAAGAGVLVPDPELDGARLDRELTTLLGASDRLESMAAAARALARPDAAARVADLVEEAAGAAR